MATGLIGHSQMSSWPKLYIPPLDGFSFAALQINDSNAGMTSVLKQAQFNIYVCGITPYDATHLGHAATYLAFDLIIRFQTLSGKEVNFIENLTDIDDPLLERAARDNLDWQQLATEQIQLFQADMSILRVVPPQKLIKVTDSMQIIEEFISRLNDAGFLYEISGDYYFKVDSYLNDLPLSVEKAVEIFASRGGDPSRLGKQHPLDPIVWVANHDNLTEPGWESKFGYGRPGWHVECTAIAIKNLDKGSSDPIITMQGGGSDLAFPHHFMSAKVVEAAYGRSFAALFVHAGMIGLNGEKMSKSKGNLVLVSDLVKEGVDPMVIRWALLTGHYQVDRQWTQSLLNQAEEQVLLVRKALAKSETANGQVLIQNVITALSMNLDTPLALSKILEWAKTDNQAATENHSGLVARALDSLLGLAL